MYKEQDGSVQVVISLTRCHRDPPLPRSLSSTSIPRPHITPHHNNTATTTTSASTATMKPATIILACLFAAAVLLPSAMPKKKWESKGCKRKNRKNKKKTFKGDGTYYGDIPISAGNCAMRGDLSVVSGSVVPTVLTMMKSFAGPRRERGR